MSKFLWILGGTTLGLAAYVITKQPQPANADGLSEAGSNLGAWGTQQRASGLGGQLKGKVEQGAGNLTGDADTADKGAFDEATGEVKDAAGKAAQAIGGAVQDLSK